MVTHIVFFKLRPELPQSETLQILKQRLEALVETIPVIEKLEVGFDFNRSASAFDLALYTTFASREALEAYQVHPDHEAVKQYIGSVTSDRAVVDYET